jgi:hypothetical protein
MIAPDGYNIKDRANTIIVDLVCSDDFNNCIVKVKPSHLQDDLKAEVSLILLQTMPEKIINLAEKKQLKFYAVRIIMNLGFSNTSPFYRKYRFPFVEFKDFVLYDDPYSLLYRFEREQQEESALSEIENLEWYPAEMTKLYVKVGTYRNMSKVTAIPVKSCHDAVKRAVNQIRKKTF